MKIELSEPTPQFLFVDMLTDATYTTELLGTKTLKSKDGTKDLVFLHIKVFHAEKGIMQEYYLSKWRAKSTIQPFSLETDKKYQMRKQGENIIFF